MLKHKVCGALRLSNSAQSSISVKECEKRQHLAKRKLLLIDTHKTMAELYVYV